MKIKGVLSALLVVSIGLLAIMISGCFNKTSISCESPKVIIGEDCCLDLNRNKACDTNETGLCGNQKCEAGENCTNCWKDCGACKRIIYIYVPRNFTLKEFELDMRSVMGNDVKFRRDIENINNVTDFFYYTKPALRYIEDVLDVKRKEFRESKAVVLNYIINDHYYVNDSESMFNYLNYTNWYLIHSIKNADMQWFEDVLSSGKATAYYPTQPTGYQKEFRYVDWEFRNLTKKETVIYDNTTSINDRLGESIYAAVTQYRVVYRSHEFLDKDEDTAEERLLEDFSIVDEKRLDFIQTLSLRCSRNLVVTLYYYDYTGDYRGILEETLLSQIKKNRGELRFIMDKLDRICNEKYSEKVFTYG